jgi:DNA-binding XRE family transcriptional regulator
MKIHPQTIYSGDQPEFVVLPIKEYDRLISAVEDFQDIQEVRNFLERPGETFPMEVVLALSEGKNPIKVYREYRGISQSTLASKANVSKQYISQLENGDRAGTTKILKKLAKILRVDLDDITI